MLLLTGVAVYSVRHFLFATDYRCEWLADQSGDSRGWNVEQYHFEREIA
jgi:hypothetical protein